MIQQEHPSAPEYEENIIAWMLSHGYIIDRLQDQLQDISFYNETYCTIFKAIHHLHSNGAPVSTSTVTEYLVSKDLYKSHEIALKLPDLHWAATEMDMIGYKVKVLQQYHIAREMVKIGNEMAYKAASKQNDPLVLLSEYQEKIQAIGSFAFLGDEVADSQAAIENEKQRYDKRTIDLANGIKAGVPSSSSGIDKITAGYQPGWLIIKGGAPGSGKSSDCISDFVVAAKAGACPVFFTAEMTESEIVQKMIVHQSGGMIDGEKLRSGELSNHELGLKSKAEHELLSHKWFIYEKTISPQKIRNIAKKLREQHDVRLIIVDYVQRVKADIKTKMREEEISHIVRSLKTLAKELKLPIIAVSSFNRGEKGTKKDSKPVMSELRGSGDLEFEADLIILFYRPAYYGIREEDGIGDTKGAIVRIVAKFRHGRTGEVLGWHNEQISNFYDSREEIPYKTEPTMKPFTHQSRDFSESFNELPAY